MTTCVSCGESFSVKRHRLGYNTCLGCGDFAACRVMHCVVPMNKSNYVLVTNPAELKQLNPKRLGE